MSRGDSACPPIGDEQWQTVRGLDRQSHFVGIRQDDVGLGRLFVVRHRLSFPVDHRRVAVHLTNTNQLRGPDLDGVRELLPRVVGSGRRRPQLPPASGQQMRRERFERTAYERGARGELHPFKTAVRLG